MCRIHFAWGMAAFGAAAIFAFATPASSDAQTTTTTGGAVGGISINADGLLTNATIDEIGALSRLRRLSAQKAPAELKSASELRRISLRGLAAAIEQAKQAKKPLPDVVRYLAGLQHVQYVFVYPEQKDIVLAGPGEGWHVDAKGYVVGEKNNRPVMLLDDLLVAMRTAQSMPGNEITCSIDPTPEGMARLRQVPIVAGADPRMMAAAFEKAMGPQKITLKGVPDTSHFARVLVAADYRMKRIAMGFDPSPVRGLPSYLQMVRPSRTIQSPRFWLEPTFDAIEVSADHLAFELLGSGVQALTEDDYFSRGGHAQHSGKANPQAQRWANLMTEKYTAIASADSIFGQLQNCMELAVVAAILTNGRLPQKASNDFAALYDATSVKLESMPAPKQTPSIASVKGRIVTVSGGVAIRSWHYAQHTKPRADLSEVRTKAAFDKNTDSHWWKN